MATELICMKCGTAIEYYPDFPVSTFQQVVDGRCDNCLKRDREFDLAFAEYEESLADPKQEPE